MKIFGSHLTHKLFCTLKVDYMVLDQDFRISELVFSHHNCCVTSQKVLMDCWFALLQKLIKLGMILKKWNVIKNLPSIFKLSKKNSNTIILGEDLIYLWTSLNKNVLIHSFFVHKRLKK